VTKHIDIKRQIYECKFNKIEMVYSMLSIVPNVLDFKLLPMDAPVRIEKSIEQVQLSRLITRFSKGEIGIPLHQREFCWKPDRQEEFIKSILMGYPVPSILMSEADDGKLSIEDGRQRLTTAMHFKDDEFDIEWGGDRTLYSGLSRTDQQIFNSDMIVVQKFANARMIDRIEIFDRIQNGTPLTVGERLYARRDSPLVSFVIDELMTPGIGFHDRAAEFWGVRGGNTPDKRRNWLLNATSIISGLIYGPSNITKKYYPELIVKPISDDTKDQVRSDLSRILDIYEESDRIEKSNKRNGSPAKHFDVGTYTGYIMFSLCSETWYSGEVYSPNSISEEKWVITMNKWVEYIVEVRRTMNANKYKTFKSVLAGKIHDADVGRNGARCDISRWENGYKRVFDIELDEPACDEATEYESVDSSEDE
jgi:hypothetical protein